MIQKAFLTVFDMSIVASIVILVVLVVRLFLKKVPKIYSYLLWTVVLFRLLCPFSVESELSIIPEQAQNIPQDVALETSVDVSPLNVLDATQRAVGDTLNGGIETVWVRLESEDVGQEGISMASHLQVWLLFAGVVWPVGMVVMVGYSVVSYVKLRRSLVGVIKLEFVEEQERKEHEKVDIYLADHVDSPFVMGVFKPKIYLPSSLAETEREYIILHEKHHICRGDHIIKFLAFMALCVHWFNPLVWVAFVQAGKDMEMSCDEAVIRQQGDEIRASYSVSLLKLATGRQIFAGTPLAFGEGDTKGRIRNLAKWKRPKVWICIVAGVVILIVAIVCVVNPKSDSRMPPSSEYGGQVAEGNDSEGELLTPITAPSLEQEYGELSKDTVFAQGTSYVTYACQYMTPLSSTLSNGDDGKRYIVGEDSFTIENRTDGKQSTYYNFTWQWQPFPWTDEEYCDLYAPGLLYEYKISEYYEEMWYQPISEGYCMLWMDGEIWLMKLNKTPQKEPYIWSIHLLMPESWRNASKSVSLNGYMTKYLGMTYQQFKEDFQCFQL